MFKTEVHGYDLAWGKAVLCSDCKAMDLCANALAQRKLPHRVRKKSGEYRLGADAIQVMTVKVSKALEFPVVAMPVVGICLRPGKISGRRRGCFM